MKTESIIVYRNPAEQAFWEMFMGGPGVVYLLAAVAFIFGFWLTSVIVEWIVGPRWRYNKLATVASFAGGAAVSAIVFFVLI